MIGTGWLEGWRLTFGGEGVVGWEGAVSTIVESPGDRVFVALYDIHPRDAADLDQVEGAAAGAYKKLTVRVATLDGEVRAWVYVLDAYEGGLPTAWYLTELANAAEAAGAPGRLRGRAAFATHHHLLDLTWERPDAPGRLDTSYSLRE